MRICKSLPHRLERGGARGRTAHGSDVSPRSLDRRLGDNRSRRSAQRHVACSTRPETADPSVLPSSASSATDLADSGAASCALGDVAHVSGRSRVSPSIRRDEEERAKNRRRWWRTHDACGPQTAGTQVLVPSRTQPSRRTSGRRARAARVPGASTSAAVMIRPTRRGLPAGPPHGSATYSVSA